MENLNLLDLQNEVEFYRENQTTVENEIRSLIADNQKLSQQVAMLLKEKMQLLREPQPQTQDSNQGQETEELRRQVVLLTKERDSLHVLWQTSQKTIDALETELKTYQQYSRTGTQNSNDDRRDMELKLETALTDYIELETKYKELNQKLNQLTTDMRNKEKELVNYIAKTEELQKELAETTKTLEEQRVNLQAEIKNNENLKSQLLMCQKESSDRIKKEIEAKAKVSEALQLFDLVSAQKNEAFKKIKDLSDELFATKQKLTEVYREAESKFRAEVDDIKENYNEKVADMLQHIRNLDSELVEKGLLLNKVLRENKVLLATNDSFMRQEKKCRNAIDPKLALAEQRMEAMFQELVSSERRNTQLVCEKQCLAIDIQRIQDIHARETKRRDWEENLLKTQRDELKMQVEHLQKSLDETHGMITKLQTMLSSRTELSQKMMTTKEEELLELNKHLQNQMELSKKWKESYVEMTEKLKKRLEELQKENNLFRSKLKLPTLESSESTS
ncbi:putative leucine-rich repeat-containing protein DDB_G0290503 [Amyelois transitella]|uniref:putative leucine-rich repeat-containing protein DDB_G0290503 n=1 Tax=Amyelois transitella TaxID=680683 RepID=UPI00298F8593|nr:putative leucine-rich repeat-containing protein DDB_G0290503 [Amyelois transitella]